MVALADKQTRDITDRAILVMTLPSVNHQLDNRIVDASTHQPIQMDQARRLDRIFRASLDTLGR